MCCHRTQSGNVTNAMTSPAGVKPEHGRTHHLYVCVCMCARTKNKGQRRIKPSYTHIHAQPFTHRTACTHTHHTPHTNTRFELSSHRWLRVHLQRRRLCRALRSTLCARCDMRRGWLARPIIVVGKRASIGTRPGAALRPPVPAPFPLHPHTHTPKWRKGAHNCAISETEAISLKTFPANCISAERKREATCKFFSPPTPHG